MTKKKVYPYINRFSGEIQVMTKDQRKQLNEDWARAKMATNDKGERVFRFKLQADVKGRDGKMHIGTATVDLTESEVDPSELEAVDVNPDPK